MIKFETIPAVAPKPAPAAPKPARLAAARKAMAETKPRTAKSNRRSNAKSNTPVSAAPFPIPPAFDKKAYQREYMARRRAEKAKAKFP